MLVHIIKKNKRSSFVKLHLFYVIHKIFDFCFKFCFNKIILI